MKINNQRKSDLADGLASFFVKNFIGKQQALAYYGMNEGKYLAIMSGNHANLRQKELETWHTNIIKN